MNILRTVVGWVKGEQHVTDNVLSTEMFEGTIPAIGSYGEERYRMRVDKHRISTTWDCEWIKAVHEYYCVVNPMSSHKVPVDIRCNSIIISTPLSKKPYKTADPEEALGLYLQFISGERFKYKPELAN